MESNYVPISVAAPVVNGAVFLSHCFSEQELSMYSFKNHSFLEFGGNHAPIGCTITQYHTTVVLGT